MGQDLQLAQIDGATMELQYYLLWVRAKPWRLPALRVDMRVQKLRDGVLGVFATAVYNPVWVLDKARWKLFHLIINCNINFYSKCYS